jgi:tetratricopeptide (TPR) repeat protein
MATTLQPNRFRLRPVGMAAAALGLVIATYGVAALRATPPPAANANGAGTGAGTGTGTGAGQVAPGLGAPPVDVTLASPGGPALAVGSLAQIDHSIAGWTENLAQESKDFYAATNLGLLYEGRARLTGDIADYDRARQALEQSIAVAPEESAARVVHARVLASLHEFPAALAEARAVFTADPTQLPALAVEGDSALELGDVATATAAYGALAKAAPGAAVDARLSRLAFIEGRPQDAWRLARQAYDEDVAAGDTGQSESWYAYVLGTLAMTSGQPQQALDWFNRAVAEWPGSFLANAGVGRAQAALGQTAAAIQAYQAAIAIAPQPDAVAALGDLYAIAGQPKLAQDDYATVEAIGHLAALNEQVFNRQLVLFSVNHDRDLAQALQLAQTELAVRKDAYGYDAVAWALLANGRAADAQVAIGQAMAFGTIDPLFEYHAGLIAQALGQHDRAVDLLQQALAPVGALDPLATARAQAALASLEARR